MKVHGAARLHAGNARCANGRLAPRNQAAPKRREKWFAVAKSAIEASFEAGNEPKVA